MKDMGAGVKASRRPDARRFAHVLKNAKGKVCGIYMRKTGLAEGESALFVCGNIHSRPEYSDLLRII
jgi:hypothetical protein